MKRLIVVFLTITFCLGLMLELTGGEDWSWRGYVHSVQENIKPLPTADLKMELPSDGDFSFLDNIGSFFEWLGECIIYPFKFFGVLWHNVLVIIDGFLPFDLGFIDVPGSSIGGSGGGDSFGDFGGGGFGGGGGGAR